MARSLEEIPIWALGLVLAWLCVGFVLFVYPGISRHGGGTEDALAKAIDRTASVPGARMSLMGGTSDAGGHGSLSGRGIVNNQTDRILFQSVASFGPGGRTHEPLTEVGDGLNSYIRSPQISAQFGTSASWVLVRGAAIQMLAERRGYKGQLPGTDSAIPNPQSLLSGLRSLSDSMHRVGTEMVRGVRTTRYSTTVDYARYLAQVKAGDADPGLQTMMGMIQGINTDRRVSVWIDDQAGLVRREQVSASESGASSSGTVEFFDFGVQPQIPLPPSSRVYDGTDSFVRQLIAQNAQ